MSARLINHPMTPPKAVAIQTLLDEQEPDTTIVIESDGPAAWAAWDAAVKELDQKEPK